MTAVTHGWATYPAPTTYLSTEMNGQVAAARVVGATITCAGNMWLDVEVSLAQQGVARTANGGIDIYVLPIVATIAYGSASLAPAAAHYRGRIEFDAAVTARVNSLVRIPIGAGDFQVCEENQTGQTLAATGNILKYAMYKDQSD